MLALKPTIRHVPVDSGEAYAREVFRNLFQLPPFFHLTDTIVDIGARDGAFAVLCAARHAGRIYSYEPDPKCFAALQRNLRTWISSRCIQDRVEHLDQVINEPIRLLKIDAQGLEYGLLDCTKLSLVEEITGIAYDLPGDDKWRARDVENLCDFLFDQGFKVRYDRAPDVKAALFWARRV